MIMTYGGGAPEIVSVTEWLTAGGPYNHGPPAVNHSVTETTPESPLSMGLERPRYATESS